MICLVFIKYVAYYSSIESLSVLLQFHRVSTTSPCTSLQLQIPWTCNPHTPHICSTFRIIGAFGIQLNICGETFCGNIRRRQAVGYFQIRATSWMFERILDAILSNNLLQLKESLNKSFPSLRLNKEILESPCLLILLIYTKHKTKR